MLNLENKVIAITGASSGIGEATAKLLAETGAKVVLGARRKLEKIVEEIHNQGGSAEFKAVNVADREDMAFIHFGTNLVASMSSLTTQVSCLYPQCENGTP